MATSIPVASDLVLVMENGTGASGNILTKKRTYKDIKTGANNDDIVTVAQALINLQDRNNLAIQRTDTVELQP